MAQGKQKPQARPQGPRTRRVDLHGYDVVGATEYATRAVADAYANGYATVELLHGAADVTEPVRPGEGRGAIKWELRRMLEAGELGANVASSELMEGLMRLSLKPNPRPRPERWGAPPPKRAAPARTWRG